MALNQVKNLLDTWKEERQRFLNSFDLVLTDCDGKCSSCSIKKNKKYLNQLYLCAFNLIVNIIMLRPQIN